MLASYSENMLIKQNLFLKIPNLYNLSCSISGHSAKKCSIWFVNLSNRITVLIQKISAVTQLSTLKTDSLRMNQ